MSALPLERSTAMVWLAPEQAGLVAAALAGAGVRVIEAGSPLVGRSAEVARLLADERGVGEVRVVDDLRSAVMGTRAELVVLASPGDFGDADVRVGGAGRGVGDRGSAAGGGSGGVGGGTALDAEDAEVLRACRARGVRVVSLEPVPSSVLSLGAGVLGRAGIASVLGGGGAGAGVVRIDPGSGLVSGPAGAAAGGGESVEAGEWARFVPALPQSRPMQEAREVLAQLGTLRCGVIQCWGSAAHGSLGARLYDAVHLATALLGLPEQVDGAYVWPSPPRGLHQAPGPSLRGLHGEVTANLRFAGGAAVVLAAGDRGGGWERSLTLIGSNGRLRLSDAGFSWIDAAGAVIDEFVVKPEGAGGAGGCDGWWIAAVADQVSRVLDGAQPASPPVDAARVLAVAGAALLSARTGEAESPGTILRMAHVG